MVSRKLEQTSLIAITDNAYLPRVLLYIKNSHTWSHFIMYVAALGLFGCVFAEDAIFVYAVGAQ